MSAHRTPGIFVTGTDTGVGKTVVAAGLVRLLADRGRAVLGLKPVASGARRTPTGLRNDDALALAAASPLERPYETINPWCFEPAVAPHLAAREAGVAIGVDALVDWYDRATSGAEVAVVEGAGGWRVPLHPEGFLSDLPERLGLPVILVVGVRLGCLNHARLTREAIERGPCRFAGWVANELDPGLPRLEDNIASLAGLLGGPALARVSWSARPTAEDTAAELDRPALLAALGLVDGLFALPENP